LDSLRKRIFFLRETADLLGLTGIECLHARAEEINRKPEYAGQFDLVTARAVARLNKLAGWALPFVKKGGLFLAMKGREVQAELEEARASIKKQGGLIKETREINISREITHTVVVIEKQ
jgi:16S rRNA (guanine527-N7)-methyltransferase